MMKYITTLFVFFGIWLLASFLNGIISGICLSFMSNEEYGRETFGFSMLFSFLFSIPLVSIVWVVTTVAQLAGSRGFVLFKIVVLTAVCSALSGAVFFINAFNKDFKEASYAVGASIVFSAVTAVTIFRNQFKKNDTTT